MRYTPFLNESVRIRPSGQESCQRTYRCVTRFGGSPEKPPHLCGGVVTHLSVGTAKKRSLHNLLILTGFLRSAHASKTVLCHGPACEPSRPRVVSGNADLFQGSRSDPYYRRLVLT